MSARVTGYPASRSRPAAVHEHETSHTNSEPRAFPAKGPGLTHPPMTTLLAEDFPGMTVHVGRG